MFNEFTTAHSTSMFNEKITKDNLILETLKKKPICQIQDIPTHKSGSPATPYITDFSCPLITKIPLNTCLQKWQKIMPHFTYRLPRSLT